MNKKALMRSSSILIGAIFLVFFLLVAPKPVSPGDLHCKILPDTEADRKAYCNECGITLAECAIKDPLTGEGVGSYGCECAERKCTEWCQNNICDWNKGVTVCKAVCSIESAMPHCVGAVNCPLAGEPCKGILCGSVRAGGACVSNEDCATDKCTIQETENYGYYGFITGNPTLSTGWKCDMREPCNSTAFSNSECFVNHACCDGKCTLGDLNDDNKIDIADIVAVALVFGFTNETEGWYPRADLDSNGIIDIIDVVAVAISFGCNA